MTLLDWENVCHLFSNNSDEEEGEDDYYDDLDVMFRKTCKGP